MKKKITGLFQFLHQVFMEFNSDSVLKYSASLAYYTIFSLAPMLIILIGISGFLFGREAMEGRIYGELKDLVGASAAMQVQDTIRNIHLSKGSFAGTVTGVIALLIGATGIFGEIQDSLNKIWGLKLKARKVWWKLLLNRLLSFSLVLSLGFVLMVSLVLNALVAGIGTHLDRYVSGSAVMLIPLFNLIMSVVVETILFAAIFKVLPDAKIKLKDVITGAFITAVLFTVGKWAIGFYIGKTNLATMYGAAGSVVIMLVWTYYSSAILYLGAEFTKVYAGTYGGKIQPNDYSMWIKTEAIPVSEVALKEDIA